MVSVESLQAAFSNIYQAMDAIDTFKVEALASMSTTIDALEVEVANAQTYVSRVRQADARDSDGSLDLGS
jgi:uncharacterized protein YaaN involved in tellurite resistance